MDSNTETNITPLKREKTETIMTTDSNTYSPVFSYDILLCIFNFLEQKKDFAVCSGVSRLWRKAASHPMFLWDVIRVWYTEYLQSCFIIIIIIIIIIITIILFCFVFWIF